MLVINERSSGNQVRFQAMLIAFVVTAGMEMTTAYAAWHFHPWGQGGFLASLTSNLLFPFCIATIVLALLLPTFITDIHITPYADGLRVNGIDRAPNGHWRIV